jgi:hypothetical protein
MTRSLLPTLLGVVLVAGASSPDAATVDGRLDPEYGPPLSTQVTATSLGDTPTDFTPFDSLDVCIGSELDGAFGFVSGGTLYLFFSGNYESYFGEPLMFPHQLQIFVDCAPGGQNRLRSDNPRVGNYLRLSDMEGLTFDADFSPDYWLACQVEGSGAQPFFAYYAQLPSGGGGEGHLLGRTSGGGPGTLTGGVNPFGIQSSINQTNRAGVTAGCGTASGAGVTTGVEWAIPLAALGSPSGPIRVCALVARAPAEVSNQVLGPVPLGTCSLGAPSGVDFEGLPGQQCFTLDASVPAVRRSWGRLKASYR